MEARLGAALNAAPAQVIVAVVAADDPSESVVAVDDRRAEGEPPENGGHRPPLQPIESESTNAWSDEAAESAFRAEARERGEPVIASRTTAETGDETDAKNLPPLNELVSRLSPEIRETLDDLFRAKFTTVRRVPKKALNKS